MDDKLVSIIVPVYNVKNYLHRCVQSILSQSYTSFELILVDDGSTDGSSRVCDDFQAKDSRISVIHKPNGGVSSARNMGIQKSRGEYILFCDSDDCVSTDWCSRLVRIMSSGTNELAVGVCRIQWQAEDDFQLCSNSSGVDSVLKRNEIALLFKAGLISSPVNKIYRKDVICSNGIQFDETLRFGEDTKFALEYLLHANGDIGFCDETLYFYDTQVPGSLTKRYVESMWDFWKYRIRMEKKVLASYGVPNDIALELTQKTELWAGIHSAENAIRRSNSTWADKILEIDKYFQDLDYRTSVTRLSLSEFHPCYRFVIKSRSALLFILWDCFYSIYARRFKNGT